MKKILLIILILWQFNSVAQTNVYKPFPTANVVWNVTYRFEFSELCQAYSYLYSGDTTVNGTTYHKLWKQGTDFYLQTKGANGIPSHDMCTNTVTDSFLVYAGAIRQVLGVKKNIFPSAPVHQRHLAV